ncbi:nuclear transport factor 2 family protein [Ketobacter sp. MCCC 1A13808]|nr:nuclear transport factor 2 family protein [Ketobacter sp. MCCC 1A13808]MVF11516.1 nuclear transport factor 2 family protein [Ketobacter sp. MCCC 1A13808]RLP53308.1 MAG: nuclear transport factor 2 family protein [Ketobacter sp.]
MAKLSLHPAVTVSMQHWHRMIEQRDLSALSELLSPDVVFRSPMAHKPYSSSPVVAMILSTVIQVFENFRYHRDFAAAEGLDVVLEFSAEVNGKELKGIDMIRFDENGKIVEFEVMIRPMSGLQALGEEMGRRVGHYLKTAPVQ